MASNQQDAGNVVTKDSTATDPVIKSVTNQLSNEIH